MHLLLALLALLIIGNGLFWGSAGASSLTLPVSVSLKSIQQAANHNLPKTLVHLDETRPFLGGLMLVDLKGTISRVGHVRLQALPDQSGLRVSVPIRAHLHAQPRGFQAHKISGSALVRFNIQPFVTPTWEAGAKISSDYFWTDPLSAQLSPQLKINIQSLVEQQMQAQLEQITTNIEQTIRQQANLRTRAKFFWNKAQQPWNIPISSAPYIKVNPQQLSISPFQFTQQEIKLLISSTFELDTGLGYVPPIQKNLRPLPPLNIDASPPSGIDLHVPISLPYHELSTIATRYAVQKTLVLPVPTSPTLKVEKITIGATDTRLTAAVNVLIQGPLGMKIHATMDITGKPALDQSTQQVILQDITFATRRQGLSGTVIAWLADARARTYLQRATQINLTPYLVKVRRQIQARLPFSPTAGIELQGTVGQLRLTNIRIQRRDLLLTAHSTGKLWAKVDF